MSGKIELGVRVTGDNAGVRRAINQVRQDFGSLSSEAGALARRVASSWSAALGGISLGAIATGILTSTARQESAQRQLEARVRATGMAAGLSADELGRMAAELQKVTTFGDEAIMGAQALALQFDKLGRDTLPRTIELSADLAAALGKDLNSATQLLGQSLNDPVAGLRSLRSIGISFSRDQRDVIASLVETGEVAKAQNIILAEVERRFGGAAKTARDTLAGALDALKNAFGDLLEGDTGSAGLRGTTQALNDLTDTLSDPQIKEGFQTIANGVLLVSRELTQGIALLGQYMARLREAAALNDLAQSGDVGGAAEQLLNARLAQVGQRIRELQNFQGPDGGRFGAEDRAYLTRRLADREAYSRTKEIEFLFEERQRIIRELSAKYRKQAEEEEVEAGLAAIAETVEEFRRNAKNASPAPRAGSSTGRAATVRDVFGPAEDALKRQIALYGQSGEAARVNFEITQGAYRGLKEDQQARLLQLAEELDALGQLADAQRARAELENRAANLIAASMTEEERYIALVRELNELQAAGLLTLEERLRIQEDAAARLRKTVEEAATEMERFAAAAGDTAINALAGALYDFATSAESAGQAMRNFVLDFVRGMAQIATRAIATIAILQGMEALFPGSTRLLTAGRVLHSGGMAESAGQTRQVNPALFALAPRYHNGGIAGLKPNEIPAILERGEEVLARNDPRNARNGGGVTPGNMRLILLDDQRRVSDFFNAPEGEEVFFEVLSRRPGQVREILGIG